MSELRRRQLLVEAANERQSMRIKDKTTLYKTAVKVTEHETLNLTKGTIHYNNKPEYTEEEIKEALTRSTGVVGCIFIHLFVYLLE